jgi:hypothetical protein
MKVLYSEIYEREGNDSWLIDKIQLIHEDGELFLRHKKNYKGWAGDIKETVEIPLDFDTIEESQNRIGEYMTNECLVPDMKIPNLEIIISENS